MLYCDKCRVTVRTMHDCCPLCHGMLSGQAEIDDEVVLFPKLNEQNARKKRFLSWFTFVLVVVAIVAYIMNSLVVPAFLWSLYVIGGLFYIWIITIFAIMKKNNIMKNIIWQEYIIGVGLILWDVATHWKGWSLEFGVPIIITIALVLSMLMKIVKKLPENEYVIYFFIHILMGILPAILATFGVFKVTFPSMICGGLAMIVLASLVIFKHHEFVEELKKKFFL